MTKPNPFAVPINACPIEHMGFPRLNAQDVARQLFDRASEILTEEGELRPVLFLITDKVCFTIPANEFMKSSEKKDALSFLIRKAAGETEIVGVALVMEAWMRAATEEEARTGIKESNRPVKDYPNKKEAIVVQCEWYNGSQYMLTGTFDKTKDATGIEEVKIEEPLGEEAFEGRFANVFRLPGEVATHTNETEGDMRAETGPMKFGDDWSGIFIRGDNAFFYLKVCEALTANNPIAEKGLEGLKQLLESSQERPDRDVTKMKSFGKCVEEG